MRINRMPGRCPVCADRLDVVKLHCSTCDTSLEGRFATSKFDALSQEQLEFVEVFLKARGNIREVERELGISYPTVRGRLDHVLEALGYRVESKHTIIDGTPADDDRAQQRKEVLDALARGELKAEEAIKLLKQS